MINFFQVSPFRDMQAASLRVSKIMKVMQNLTRMSYGAKMRVTVVTLLIICITKPSARSWE